MSIGSLVDTKKTLADFEQLPLLESDVVIDLPTKVSSSGLKILCASGLVPRSVHWIWYGWIAAGKIHIIAGTPGTGKTTIAMALAAVISNGNRWPDNTACLPGGNVLIWTGEDDYEDTLLPRLLAHGANLDRIFFVGDVVNNEDVRPFDPAHDVPILCERAQEIGGIKLIIIDPIVMAVSGDSNKNSDVRRALQPLLELGVSHNIAIIGISHFTKGTKGQDPIERVNGSIAFSALARVLMVTHKTNDKKTLLARAKSNLGPNGGAFYYEIEQTKVPNYDNISASCLKWGSFVEEVPQDLIAAPTGNQKRDTAVQEARDFLRRLLSDGPVPASEALRKADELGISSSTLERAKRQVGVNAVKKGSGWVWQLPPKEVSQDMRGTSDSPYEVVGDDDDLASWMEDEI